MIFAARASSCCSVSSSESESEGAYCAGSATASGAVLGVEVGRVGSVISSVSVSGAAVVMSCTNGFWIDSSTGFVGLAAFDAGGCACAREAEGLVVRLKERVGCCCWEEGPEVRRRFGGIAVL